MKKSIELAEENLIHSYNRYPVELDHGEDVYLYDTEGKKYLDFAAGIAVCALGYSNEAYKEALKAQIDKGIHFSNYFYSEPLKDAVKNISEATGLDKVFMANSGTEANEGALKIARKYAISKGYTNRSEVIAMDKAFHGRTMGALSVTGTKKYRENFEPLISGVTFCDFNNLESVKSAITDKTYAIILEPVQGEGGIYPATKEFIQGVRELCDKHDIVMICDEIQCGMGRTGKMFAFQNYDIKPDIVTLAKGVGNGIVVGAIATKKEVGEQLVPGDHGTTFGGNPLSCAAVNATFDEFKKQGILDNVNEVGEYLVSKLQSLKEKHSCIKDVRGLGFMLGIEVDIPVGDVCKKCLESGLIVLSAGSNVVRLVPPLVISKENVDEMINILDSALEQ
ncbi:aspartate aminotransferase family protein [Eubacterium xylanophilum]|uniref:aspartate aminotransferase family protein n=1 Tax=Eubacterium xylanophilum TaxID=39497 RepID=UPI00047C856F|nr:aspartate aminotransferase family protein [Eubacterium xylanophilum]